jgi:branched-chain amino acid transport system substrate-binding protein
MQRIAYYLFIVSMVYLVVGCDQKKPILPSGKVVKIGLIGPFTGADGAKGRESIKGIRTVMHMQPLLHNGDAIELVVENDDNDPELTERALRKLSQEDKVSAVLLASGTKAALKVGSFVDTSKIPVIALLATHPGVVEKREFISQLCFDDRFQGSVAALFVADELLIENVAVFTESDDMYSIFLGAEFVRKYEAVGGIITDTIVLNEEQDDYDQVLSGLRDKGAELIYIPGTEKYVLEIVKAAKNIGWEPEMMGSDGLFASVLHNSPQDVDLLTGIYSTELFGTLDNVIKSKFAIKARKTYFSLFKGIPSSYTALGAEGYGILYAAMDKCNDSTDRECINRMIQKTDKFDGIMSRISIGTDGKAVRPLFVNRINDGKLDVVVKVY